MKRVWVDANVLLRFLTGQPQDLAERARAFFEQVERGLVEAGVSLLVLAEVVWVLRSFYNPFSALRGSQHLDMTWAREIFS